MRKSLCSVTTTVGHCLAGMSTFYNKSGFFFSRVVKLITKYIEDVGPIQVEADFTRERKSKDRPQLGSWCKNKQDKDQYDNQLVFFIANKSTFTKT